MSTTKESETTTPHEMLTGSTEKMERVRSRVAIRTHQRRETMKLEHPELWAAEKLKDRIRQRRSRETLDAVKLEAERIKNRIRQRQRREEMRKDSQATNSGFRMMFPENLVSKTLTAELELRNIIPQPSKQGTSRNTVVRRGSVKNVPCNFCNSIFRFAKGRVTHTLEIHGIKSMTQFAKFCCDKCGEVLNSRSDIVNHLSKHIDNQAKSQEDTLFCYLCDSPDCYLQFIAKKDLKQHLSTHHSAEHISESQTDSGPFHCQQCDKSFAVKINYETHLNKIHGSSNHKATVVDCPFCWGIFTLNELRGHLEEHALILSKSQEHEVASNSLSILCDECGKVFSDDELLRKHRRAVHYNNFSRKFQTKFIWDCGVCGKKCQSKERLHSHYLRYHTYEHGTLCHVCNRRFETLHSLNIHLQRHSGTPFLSNRFNCFYCTKVFSGVMMRNKHHVLAHIDKYLVLRPFYCIACYANFETEEIRDVHYETHLKWKCSFCSLHHFSLGAFNRHMDSHSKPGSRAGTVRMKLQERRDKKLMEVGDPIVEVLGNDKRETVRRLRENPENYSIVREKLPDHSENLTQVLQTTLDTFEGEIQTEVTLDDSQLKPKSLAPAHSEGKSQSSEGISVVINKELEFHCKICSQQFSIRDEVLTHHHSHVTAPSLEGEEQPVENEMTEDDILSNYKNPNYIGLTSAPKPIFKCDFCEIDFESAEAIVSHRKESHGIDPEQHVYKLQCELCPRRFNDTTYLQRHLKHFHSKSNCREEEEEEARAKNSELLTKDHNEKTKRTRPAKKLSTKISTQRKWEKPHASTAGPIKMRRTRGGLQDNAMREQSLAEKVKRRVVNSATTGSPLTRLRRTRDKSGTALVVPISPLSILPDDTIEDSSSVGSFGPFPEDDNDSAMDDDELPFIRTRSRSAANRSVNRGQMILPDFVSPEDDGLAIFPMECDPTEVDFSAVAAETKDGIIIIDSSEHVFPNGSSGREFPKSVESNQSSKANISQNVQQEKSFSKMQQQVTRNVCNGVNSRTRQMIKDLPFAFVVTPRLPTDYEKPKLHDLLYEKSGQQNSLARRRGRPPKEKLNAAEPLGETGKSAKTSISRNAAGSIKQSSSASASNAVISKSSKVKTSTESEVLWLGARARRERKIQPGVGESFEPSENRTLDSDWQQSDDEIAGSRRSRTKSKRKSLSSNKSGKTKISKSKSGLIGKTEPCKTSVEDEETSTDVSLSNPDSKSCGADEVKEKVGSKRKRKSSSRLETKKPKQQDDVTAKSPNTRLWKCVHCPAQFLMRKEQRKHSQTEHGPKVMCDLCDLPFPDKFAVKEHQIQEHSGAHNQCAVESCQKVFPKREFLFGHFERVHRGNSAPHKCPECRFASPYLQEYTRHCRKAHDMSHERSSALLLENFVNSQLDVTSKYHCDFCDAVFVGGRAYNLHVRTHTASNTQSTTMEKACDLDGVQVLFMYLCDFAGCNSVFRGADNLRQHIDEMHCPSGHFTCSTCKRIFAEQRSLNQHAQNVHGNGLTECLYCNEAFQTREEAQKHNVLHIVDLEADLADSLEVNASSPKGVGGTKKGGKKHYCPECNIACKSEFYLEVHIERVHKGNKPKPFKCEVCDLAFAEKHRMIKHQHREHGIRGEGLNLLTRRYTIESSAIFHCDICFGVCQGKFRYNRHVREHLEVNESLRLTFPTVLTMYLCDYKDCNGMYRGKDLLMHHFESHRSDSNECPFPCSHCDKVYAERDHLAHHVQEFHNTARTAFVQFECSFCQELFQEKKTVDKHEELHKIDLNEPLLQYICEICGKEHASSGLLTNHVRSVHIRNRPRKNGNPKSGNTKEICPYCGDSVYKQQRNKHQYSQHREEFVSANPFFCDLCFKPGRSPAIVQFHRQSHDNMKCNICNKQFLRRHYLDAHMHSHNGEKPFECPQCDRSFTSKMVLNEHLLRHEKKYRVFCSICPSNTVGFYRMCHLEQHMESVHVNGNGKKKRERETQPRSIRKPKEKQMSVTEESVKQLGLESEGYWESGSDGLSLRI